MFAQDRLGIKGVSLGQLKAELPRELSETCKPAAHQSQDCTLWFEPQDKRKSLLSSVAGSGVNSWIVKLAGAPAAVVSITVRVRASDPLALFGAIEDKYAGSRCKLGDCRIDKGTDGLFVYLSGIELVVSVDSVESRALDKARSDAAKKDI